MTTIKTPNYSEKQETEMDTLYTGATTDEERANVVEALRTAYDKTPASIRSKLSRMGIYIKPAKVSKATGGVVVRKPELVAQLAEKLGLEGNDVKKVDSGNKATKTFLELVLAQMSYLEERIAEFEAEDLEIEIPVIK